MAAGRFNPDFDRAKRKRGRPEHAPSAATRKRVIRYLAGGMTEIETATAIGISKPTLLKHYPEQIQMAFAAGKAQALDAMWKAAEKGNAGAAWRLVGKAEVAAANAKFLGNEDGKSSAPEEKSAPRRQRTQPEGKKEVAQARALTAGEGTEWAGDLVPPTVKDMN